MLCITVKIINIGNISMNELQGKICSQSFYVFPFINMFLTSKEISNFFFEFLLQLFPNSNINVAL